MQLWRSSPPQEQSGPKSQKNPLHAEPPRSNFVTVRKWCLTHQFALQIGSHAQNEFGGANLRTRIFLCRIACLGMQPATQPELALSSKLRTNHLQATRDQARISSESQTQDQSQTSSPDQARVSSEFQARNESLTSSPRAISSQSQKNTLRSEPPRSNFVTVRNWYLSHQFALQIGSHAQNDFGGANLRTRIFLCRIAGWGTRPATQPELAISSKF